MFFTRDASIPAPEDALPGREHRWFGLADRHLVLDAPLVTDEVPEGLEVALFGLGCFWGAEEIFWQVPGVWSTSVGYAGGHTPNPSYEEVCTGRTGHTEAVRIVFDPAQVGFGELVGTFFEVHDPTQGMRQGNDTGTQYRSAIYWTTPLQAHIASAMTDLYGQVLAAKGFDPITTELRSAEEVSYFYAEDYHQQYLRKVPHGYRCHAKTGVAFPAQARSIAEVGIDRPARFGKQLTSHLGRKQGGEWDAEENAGTITFIGGNARLFTDEEILRMELDADGNRIGQLENVLARHLIRFASDQSVQVSWARVPR